MFDTLLQQLDQSTPSIADYKQTHKAGSELLAEKFHAGEAIEILVRGRAELVDQLLKRVWAKHLGDSSVASLIAVGGYGRGELHPASDVDLLILTQVEPETLAPSLEPLIMFLWDIGLEVGHSVRTLEECIEEARKDVTIATNLMESRLLSGNKSLFDSMSEQTNSSHMWPSDEFFTAKLEEQKARHSKVDGSSHDLEPNIKSNPGGLRDIQIIGWVVKRHYGDNKLVDLFERGFLTEKEYKTLIDGERFLWRIRFALHLLTGRHDDRLLFEHQRKLAAQFGYNDENTNLAVEQFMQTYYRTVVRLQRLNEVLLQLFNEEILLNKQVGKPVAINRRFQTRDDYLEVINPGLFAKNPLSMLEIFLLLEQHPEIKGVRASTIRSIRAHRHLIDENLRNSIQAKSLFMELLRQPAGITHEFRRMHRYGILARYIPAFHKITGLMQFDLFHLYTVDEHILMVLRNCRRVSLEKHKHECPLCHTLFHQLPKPELLYLGALFHDIAKGRGGDHSELGKVDAYEFSRQHDLSEYDSRLVAWLVEQHLVMSFTAQRQDIDDPEVIQAFAEKVGSVERLTYLYLLTVADMRGTNPARWNSWKGALLDRLYHSTKSALERGLEQPVKEEQIVIQRQKEAKTFAALTSHTEKAINEIWRTITDDYFVQTTPDMIAWHTDILIKTPDDNQTRVYAHKAEELGCLEILTVGKDRDGLFATTTAILDQLVTNILGARIGQTSDDISMNSYYILEEDGRFISKEREDEIIEAITEALNQATLDKLVITRRLSRQQKSFNKATEISHQINKVTQTTELTVVTSDRPGLLSIISNTFRREAVRLHGARVVTEGAVARDTFLLSDYDDNPLDNDAIKKLTGILMSELDD